MFTDIYIYKYDLVWIIMARLVSMIQNMMTTSIIKASIAQVFLRLGKKDTGAENGPVSYTHLTLPTILRV